MTEEIAAWRLRRHQVDSYSSGWNDAFTGNEVHTPAFFEETYNLGWNDCKTYLLLANEQEATDPQPKSVTYITGYDTGFVDGAFNLAMWENSGNYRAGYYKGVSDRESSN